MSLSLSHFHHFCSRQTAISRLSTVVFLSFPSSLFNWRQCCLECQTMCGAPNGSGKSQGCPWHLPSDSRPTVEILYPCSAMWVCFKSKWSGSGRFVICEIRHIVVLSSKIKTTVSVSNEHQTLLKSIVSQVPLYALDIRSTINVVCKFAAYEERRPRRRLPELEIP